LNNSDDAGLRDTGDNLVASKFRELFCDKGRCLGQVEQQFWMLMDRAPPIGGFSSDVVDSQRAFMIRPPDFNFSGFGVGHSFYQTANFHVDEGNPPDLALPPIKSAKR
jgi:hypothetical protein